MRYSAMGLILCKEEVRSSSLLGSTDVRTNGRQRAALASLEVRAGRGRQEGEGSRQPASSLSVQASAWLRAVP